MALKLSHRTRTENVSHGAVTESTSQMEKSKLRESRGTLRPKEAGVVSYLVLAVLCITSLAQEATEDQHMSSSNSAQHSLDDQPSSMRSSAASENKSDGTEVETAQQLSGITKKKRRNGNTETTTATKQKAALTQQSQSGNKGKIPTDDELREAIASIQAANPGYGQARVFAGIKEEFPDWALRNQRVLKMRRKMREEEEDESDLREMGDVDRNNEGKRSARVPTEQEGKSSSRVPTEQELRAEIEKIQKSNPAFGTARVFASIKKQRPEWAVRTQRVLKLRRRMREEEDDEEEETGVAAEQEGEEEEAEVLTAEAVDGVWRSSTTMEAAEDAQAAPRAAGVESAVEAEKPAALVAPPQRDQIIDSILLYQRHFNLLIDLEQDEQEEEVIWRLKKWSSAKLEEEGLSVVGLHSRPVGEVFGEKILELSTGFGARNQDDGWLFRKFKLGDVVLVSTGFGSPLYNKVPSVEAIVSDKGGSFMHLAVQSWPAGVWSGRRRAEYGEKLFRVDKFYSALPFQRMRSALRAAERPEAMSEPLRRLLFQSPMRYYLPEESRGRDRGFGRRPDDLPAAPAPPEGWERFTSQPPAVQLDGRTAVREEEIEEVVDAVALANGCNPSQKSAIVKAIGRQCTVIQGPPGTGKTFTASCVVQALIRLKQRGHADGVRSHTVLATAHSNTATDNLMEKLISMGISVVRVGRSATVATHLRGFTMDAMLDQDPDVKRLRSMMFGAIDATQVALQHQLVGQRIESTSRILRSVDVIVASLVGSGHESLTRMMDENGIRFHTVVMDEASQATEPSALVPMVRGCQRLVLVGDQCQLPPTVLSREGQLNGLSDSLFVRLVKQGLEPSLLNVQFRMHPNLALFPSVTFYDGKVISAPSPSDRPPPDSFPFPTPSFPVAFIHVRRNSNVGDEQRSADGKSFVNAGEARLVVQIVEELLRAESERESADEDEDWLDEWTEEDWRDGEDSRSDGSGALGSDAGERGKMQSLRPEDVGVVSGYAGQVLEIRELLEERAIMVGGAPLRRVEVNTVDAFQGREKDVMVISTVRSNAVSSLGFLSDWRRLNVALTRAKRGLVIVGDEWTLRCDPYWERLLDLLDDRGCFLREGALLAEYSSREDRRARQSGR